MGHSRLPQTTPAESDPFTLTLIPPEPQLPAEAILGAKKKGRPKGGFKKLDPEHITSALKATHGLISPAAKLLAVDVSTLRKQLTAVHYAEIVAFRDDISDLAEQSLFAQIQRGDERAIQFWLKYQGKGRGYSEKQEIKVEEVSSPEASRKRKAGIEALFKSLAGKSDDPGQPVHP